MSPPTVRPRSGNRFRGNEVHLNVCNPAFPDFELPVVYEEHGVRAFERDHISGARRKPCAALEILRQRRWA